MSTLRKVEVFSAGCLACDEVVQLVRNVACHSCDERRVTVKEQKIVHGQNSR